MSNSKLFFDPEARAWLADGVELYESSPKVFEWGIPNRDDGWHMKFGEGRFKDRQAAERYMHFALSQHPVAIKHAMDCLREHKKLREMGRG